MMRIQLSEMADNEERVEEVPVGEGALDISLPDEEGRISKVSLSALVFERDSSGRLSVSGEGTAKVVIPCARCLKDVDVEVAISIDYAFRVEGDAIFDDPEDPLEAFSEGVLDVDALILSEILTNLPAKVLCREDCKGLCPKCGQDLNAAECGCDRFVPDPRMQKFLDVFSIDNTDLNK